MHIMQKQKDVMVIVAEFRGGSFVCLKYFGCFTGFDTPYNSPLSAVINKSPVNLMRSCFLKFCICKKFLIDFFVIFKE